MPHSRCFKNSCLWSLAGLLQYALTPISDGVGITSRMSEIAMTLVCRPWVFNNFAFLELSSVLAHYGLDSHLSKCTITCTSVGGLGVRGGGWRGVWSAPFRQIRPCARPVQRRPPNQRCMHANHFPPFPQTKSQCTAWLAKLVIDGIRNMHNKLIL